MNNWNFTGNLGNDCDTRFLASGDAVTSFSVAVKSGYGNNEKTVWAKCAIFGKRGESLAPFLVKGTSVAVCGELSLNEWTDKEGKTRTQVQVRVQDVTLMGGRRPEQEGKPATKQDDPDSEIPF